VLALHERVHQLKATPAFSVELLEEKEWLKQ